MEEHLQSWLTHTATGTVCIAVGFAIRSLLAYKLKAQNQTDSQWQAMVVSLQAIVATGNARITALESKVDQLNKEHGECLQSQAALTAKIEVLERLQDRGPNRHAPGTT